MDTRRAQHTLFVPYFSTIITAHTPLMDATRYFMKTIRNAYSLTALPSGKIKDCDRLLKLLIQLRRIAADFKKQTPEPIAKPLQRPEGPEANRPGREAGIR
jgi:hypothetical protein